jgi:hypothetical protein
VGEAVGLCHREPGGLVRGGKAACAGKRSSLIRCEVCCVVQEGVSGVEGRGGCR